MIGWFGASNAVGYVPEEHLGLPNPEDVKAGRVAYKIRSARGLTCAGSHRLPRDRR